MQTVKLGLWEFEVDPEATKKYYERFTFPEPDTQCSRNYREYCQNLTEQERGFFDVLGIDPKCCHVSTVGLTKEKNYPTFGAYYFAGKFLKKPKENIMTAEEFVKKNFVHDYPDPRICAGNYLFEFMDPESILARIPEDMPQGFICVGFSSGKMPWLLKEKCEEHMYYLPKPWQLIKKTRRKIANFKWAKDSAEELKNKLTLVFERHKLSYEFMSKSKVKSYMKRWFTEIVPPHNQDEARSHCFSGGGFNNYLWHAFSYEYAPCVQGDEAGPEFNKHRHGKAVLIMNYEKIGFTLYGTDGITAEELDEFNDVIITHENFSWSYVHTHEASCGPYFYQKTEPAIP